MIYVLVFSKSHTDIFWGTVKVIGTKDGVPTQEELLLSYESWRSEHSEVFDKVLQLGQKNVQVGTQRKGHNFYPGT